MVVCICCNRAVFKPKWAAKKAPETYLVRLETTKGQFDVQVQREWSPLAADRFYQLVKHKFYDSAIFYRVVPNFVAQFGGKDWSASQQWMKYKIADESVVHSNKKGSLSFARDGKETRGDALFINLRDNPRLDTLNYNGVIGFPPFGEVVTGMEVVSALYSGYGDTTMSKLKTMYENHAQFLNLFPGLDVIRKVYILKK
jgi:homoserine O-acetyltransferase